MRLNPSLKSAADPERAIRPHSRRCDLLFDRIHRMSSAKATGLPASRDIPALAAPAVRPRLRNVRQLREAWRRDTGLCMVSSFFSWAFHFWADSNPVRNGRALLVIARLCKESAAGRARGSVKNDGKQ